MLTKEGLEKWLDQQEERGPKPAIDCYRNAVGAVFNHTEPSPEQTLAIRKLQESIFWLSLAPRR